VDLWKEVKPAQDEFWQDIQEKQRRLVKTLLEGALEEEMAVLLEAGRYRRTETRRGRRNGFYQRDLVTQFGIVTAIRVPRARNGEVERSVFSAYKRRQAQVDLLIRDIFLAGVSTRRVGETLESLLGTPVSAQTVSRVARSLDREVQRFHEAPLGDDLQYLFLDGVSMRLKVAAGVKRRMVLCAYGVSLSGERRLLDFRLHDSESQANWEAFLSQLRERGLLGKQLRLVATDGGSGLHAALQTVYPYVPRQRCWAHKLRNVANLLKRTQQEEYTEHLCARRVVIIPDNDDAGRQHARQVADYMRAKAAEVRLLTLPGLPDKGDVGDWLNAGGSAEDLIDLVEHATVVSPDDVAEQEAAVSDAAFHQTDAGNGELFARLYGTRLRFDHRRRVWLVWTGHWWTEDKDGEVRRLAKDAARQRYADAVAIEDLDARAKESRFAIGSENRSRLDSMISQAQVEHPIASAGDAWNTHAFLLGVDNGVVDLMRAELRVGRPEDCITLHTRVEFDENAPCPRWQQFLQEVFGDADLIDYIWRAVGYSLTGDVSDQSVFMCFGTGANGKSVFLAVLRHVLGDYAFNAPFATFELNSRSSIPNDVAALVGRRLVTASETNEDARLNEGRLKSLTGGDPTTARFLHGEFFTFEPVGKFWLAVNHRPKVKDDSYGFWRRVRLIPFTHRFTSDADPALIDKLLGELRGILAWAVRGCLEWQQRGLTAPALVTAATEAYRSESDALASFLEECCVTSEDISVGANEIAKAYQSWAMRSGMRQSEVLTSTTFGRRMSERFSKQHTKTGNVYRGVGLLTQRSQELTPAPPVKGLVKGFESDDGKATLNPKQKRLT
jgi:putative DNA primase/helicase